MGIQKLKPDQHKQIEFIKDCLTIPWLAEYLKHQNIFKISPPECANRINAYGYYVYALINPFDGKIFYIGKGKDKRAQYHLKLSKSDNNSIKKQKIEDIYKLNERPIIWVLEHNLEEKQSIHLETLLINVLRNDLTNILIPELQSDNFYLQNNIELIYKGLKDVDEYEITDAECEDISIGEMINLMTLVVKNGGRVHCESHTYYYNNKLYNFDNCIHFLPSKLRNKRATGYYISFTK